MISLLAYQLLILTFNTPIHNKDLNLETYFEYGQVGKY